MAGNDIHSESGILKGGLPGTIIRNQKIETGLDKGKVYKILHLEDVPGDVLLVANALKKGGMFYEAKIVESKTEFIKALNEFSPDIILADHSLPSFNSGEALSIFQATGMKIPFILITSAMSDEFAVNILKKGADDYILKDRLSRLVSAIQNSLEKFQLEKERQSYLYELEEKEKRYRSLVENSMDAVVILNAEGTPTYVSPSVKKILGYTEDEVKSLDLLTIAHPDDIPALAIVMQHAIANPGRPVMGHTGRMRHKDGSWRWLEATVTNLLHDPAINGIVDNFRDITDKKIAEENLLNNEHKFRRLIENGGDGIAILSIEGKPLYVSPSIKKILGYSQEEGMQLDLFTLAHPEDVSILTAVIQQAMAQPGIPVSGDATRMRHKDGSWRWIDGVITNMLHDPAVNGIVDNFRDVTERKLAEIKINHANWLYAFISQVNQCIMHSHDEQMVFKEVCRIAIDHGKFRGAWIGLFDARRQTITLVEGSGILQKDIPRFKNVPYMGDGPQDYVLKSDGYYTCNDIRSNVDLTDWKQFAIDNDIGSIMVLPIRKSGIIIGTFNLYAKEINFFTATEIALLEEATGDLSFALNIFEKEALKVQADEKLADSESSLKQAQAIAHLGSWEMNYITDTAIWSEEQLRIYGLDPHQAKQSFELWLSFVHPDDMDYVLRVTTETKLSFSDSDFFYRILLKDGTIRYLYALIRPKLNSEGILIGIYGVTQDITESKKAEQALRESESNLQAIFENSSEGFILADTNGTIKSFNNRSKEIIRLNIQKEITIGSSIYDFIHPSRKNNYKGAIKRVLKGETLRYDYSYPRENGEIKWFDFKINPVYVIGKITGLIITSTDITERKQAEELLKRSESNLNAVIENTDAFIYSLDRDFKYITFNSALLKMMKELYGLDITPGYHVFDFINKVDPTGAQEWRDIYSKALNGAIIKFEKEFIVGDFRSYTSFSIHPIWEKENVIGLSCFVHDITREKKNEEETRFQASLLNTIGQAAVATDNNGYINYWNKAAEVIYGWRKEEAIGQNISDLTASHHASGKRTGVTNELEQGHSWSGELIFQRKDGTYFPAFVTGSPIYTSNQQLSGTITVSSDITEKKNLENLLDKANRLARIGSWEIDVAKGSLFWSAVTKVIHGVPDDFLPDFDTALSFYKTGASREAITLAINEAMQKGVPFDLELQVITPQLVECWVRANGEAEFIGDKCLRVYGSFQDIDKSKKAEIEILKVYEDKNTILESIGDAFFAVDKNWIVTYWNNQAERMLQTSKDKILGQNLWEVFSGSIDSESYKQYHLTMLTKELTCFQDYFPALFKWFDINAYPSDSGLSVFFKDITQQRNLEVERERMTSDIIQRNKVLEQFSYIISHNLRAPVANIIGLAFTLQKNNLDDEIKKKVISGLSFSVNKLDEVINDLNHILTVRSEMKMLTEIVSFSELTADIWLSIEHMVERQDAVIAIDFSAVNQIRTIKSYLHSIFYNLISNSLKYRQAEIPPKIEIKSYKEKDKIVLIFKDNGLGIDLEKKGGEIFGLYKRFHKTRAEGKGMGLYMVKAQVESLGGNIRVTSEINKGTAFRIELES